MAAATKEGTQPAGQPAQPSYFSGVGKDLQNDYKSVLNQAVWNAALLYPFYAYDLDGKYFNRYDGDVVSAAKLAGLAAGIGEVQKLVRKNLLLMGVSNKVTHPFGMS